MKLGGLRNEDSSGIAEPLHSLRCERTRRKKEGRAKSGMEQRGEEADELAVIAIVPRTRHRRQAECERQIERGILVVSHSVKTTQRVI